MERAKVVVLYASTHELVVDSMKAWLATHKDRAVVGFAVNSLCGASVSNSWAVVIMYRRDKECDDS